MKRALLIALAFIAIVSCKEDKEFNTPAFEGTKDNVRWRAEGEIAFTDADGNFNIRGEIGNEEVLLTVPSRAEGVYKIVKDNDSSTPDVVQFVATYTDIDGTFYSTENEPDASLTVYPVGGTIFIDEISADGSYVSGRFQFGAFTNDGLQGVTFSGNAKRDNETRRYGVFYRVDSTFSVAPANTGNAQACADAQTTSDAAEVTFNSVAIGDPTYTTVCNTYKMALQAEIAACGDTSGALQAEIDALGTCM